VERAVAADDPERPVLHPPHLGAEHLAVGAPVDAHAPRQAAGRVGRAQRQQRA
jgi:hypothetical protein